MNLCNIDFPVGNARRSVKWGRLPACLRGHPARESAELGLEALPKQAGSLPHFAGSKWFVWLTCALLFIFAIAAPQISNAHGELLIQIAAVTKKIEGATNNPAQLYLDRAELHREHQDWDAAKSDYDRASQLDSTLASVDFCRAKMLDDSGQLESARAMFDKVISQNPQDGEAFIGRARVLVKLNERESAIADFRRGLQLLAQPKPEHFLELAQTLKSDGNVGAALHTLDAGIEKFGSIVLLQGYALDLEVERKNHAAALSRIDTIIERAPRKENWLARRGEILMSAGRFAEARDAFDASLENIKILPGILQKGPPMQKLRAEIDQSLARIADATNSQSRNATNEN